MAEFAGTTSSSDLLANELRPSAVPACAAARATAISPSGWTACTPVGETSTGIDSSTPITVVASSRCAGPVAIRGMKPSSRNASTLSLEESPRSAPAINAP